MQTNYKGTAIIGSSALVTSIANAEIIAVGSRVFNMAMQNDAQCTIIVNGNPPVFLRADQGIFVSVCTSFKIVEAGVTYNWTGVLA
jgi:hypothetical protein